MSTLRLVTIALGLAVVILLIYLPFRGDGGGSSPSRSVPTAQATCERAWTENKDNVYNVARTKAEYMTNCVGVQNELEQIRRDHQ